MSAIRLFDEPILIIQPMFDASRPPERNHLTGVLGDAAPLWDAVIDSVRMRAPQLIEHWHFAGQKIGWSLRLVEKARVLIYLTPDAGRFRVGLVLGGKAVAAARASGLSAAAASILEIAPRYAEGQGVRFHVISRENMAPLEELLDIKFAASGKKSKPREHD